MPYTKNQDTTLYYEEYGEGEPLVLIIGLGGASESWLFYANRLKERYRVICPDNRGAGKSDKPDETYTVPIFSQDLLAIFDHAGIDKAIVVGLSMGGLIAQEFYHQNPDRVSALVLSSTGIGPNDPAFINPPARVNEILQQHKRTPNAKDYSDFVSIFYHASYLEKMPKLLEKIEEYMEHDHQPPHAYHRQLEACYTHPPNSTRLANIKVPTLVIHGSDDQLWPLPNAYYMQKNIPNCQLHVVPDAGHMLFIEQAETFYQALNSFLLEL